MSRVTVAVAQPALAQRPISTYCAKCANTGILVEEIDEEVHVIVMRACSCLKEALQSNIMRASYLHRAVYPIIYRKPELVSYEQYVYCEYDCSGTGYIFDLPIDDGDMWVIARRCPCGWPKNSSRLREILDRQNITFPIRFQCRICGNKGFAKATGQTDWRRCPFCDSPPDPCIAVEFEAQEARRRAEQELAVQAHRKARKEREEREEAYAARVEARAYYRTEILPALKKGAGKYLDCTFEAFRTDIELPEIMYEGELLSGEVQNSFQRNALDVCQRYAEEGHIYAPDADDRKTWLYLHGPTGTGKSSLAGAIANFYHSGNLDAQQKGDIVTIAFINAPELIRQYRAGFADHTADDIITYYREVELLILDDLGMQQRSENSDALIDELLEYRQAHNLATIITSNLKPEGQPERSASRIVGMSTIIELPICDMRKIQQQERSCTSA